MHTTTRVVLGVVLIACLRSSPPAAQVSACGGGFIQPAGSPIAVALHPRIDRAADVNLDGKPDLVVLNYTSHTFTVLLGNGVGGFSQPPGSPVPTLSAEQTLTVADFNLDGKPDVAVVHAFPGKVSVYLGDGSGGFAQAADPPTVAGGDTVAIAAGDLNRDGKLDVVTADLNLGTLWVLLGNGAGGFITAPGSPVASGGNGAGPGLVVSDFNYDGNPDVAVTNQNSDSVSILLGNGTGGLVPAPGSPVQTGTAFELTAGDLNLDGNADLVVAGQLNVTVLLGNGSGGFVRFDVLTAPVINNGQGFFVGTSIGDLNVDGKPDIVVLNYWTEAFSILIGDGAGGFVELTDPSFGPVSTPRDAPVADFNLDGRPDLAVANFSASTVSIFVESHAPDGTGCDDGDDCTTGDSCQGGSCVGTEPNCDDGNDCTTDVADPDASCQCSHSPAPFETPCDDGNACTGSGGSPDSCDGAGACVGGLPPNVDDANACTIDSCDPETGAVYVPLECDDGNICNGVETCDPATGCVEGEYLECSDGNTCNGHESCVPGTGCIPGTPPNFCDDGNRCNGIETCDPETGCVAGISLICDDGNACNGVETCNPYSGCVAGAPVVCAPAGQCQTAGVCSPGTGACSYGTQPNGTSCNDGDSATSPDTCQAGICVGEASCTSTHNPRTVGFWRNVCRRGTFRGETIDNTDAVCVGQLSATFGGFTARNQVCNVLDGDHDHHDDFRRSSCSKAEDQLMALALNLCKERVCCDDGIDSKCDNNGHEDDLAFNHNHHGDDDDDDGHPDGDDDDDDDPDDGEGGTVCGSFNTADALLDDSGRTSSECTMAECLSKEVNNGHALEFATLVVRREGANTRLAWLSPVLNDGTARPDSYRIWRRDSRSTAPFVQIGSTMGTEYLDVTGGNGSWEYDVTAVLPNSEGDD